MKTSSAILSIIEYGTKAPSSHNSQPWKFKISENEIQIHPDFARALPIADPDNHALYISLGCSAENIILASRNLGYNSVLQIDKDFAGIDYISIRLEHDREIKKDDLFEYIGERQVNRNAYNDTSIPKEHLNLLIGETNFKGIKIRSFSSLKEFHQLEPYIIEGNNLQFKKKAFVDELISWIRFSKMEAEKKRDGIWHASLDIPGVGRTLGKLILKNFVGAKSENERWKKLISSTDTFILFLAERDDIPHWITMGRAFQRLGLMATKLKINHAHVNLPCEEKEVRKKMAAALEIVKEQPLLLIRLGYSKKLPHSYRRPVEDVILK